MRIIAEIPNPLMRITILGWNEKYQLRYELDRYEQTFKFDINKYSIEEVKELGEKMSEEVLLRFVNMREQLTSNIKS